MQDVFLVQYRGFQPRSLVREYTFGVKQGDSEFIEYTLTIPNEAFLDHRVRFQDGPDICSHRLRRELADNPALPPHIHYRITENDLDDYRTRHTPRPAQRFSFRKNAPTA